MYQILYTLVMKFIIGLGNIGAKYDDTRHNAGFMAIDAYVHANELGEWTERQKFQAYLIQDQQNGIFYIKPTTFMNLSGQTIAMAMAFYNVQPEDILIIQDDVDIDFGKIKVRQGGGDGGHNGIKSLPKSVQERAWRLRIGVKNEHFDTTDTAKFVLDRFTSSELKSFDDIIIKTNQLIANFNEGNIKTESLST